MVLLNWAGEKVIELVNYLGYAIQNYQWVYFTLFGLALFSAYSGTKNLLWSIKENDKKKYSSNFLSAAWGILMLFVLFKFG
ncbi:hypothetical protein D3C75_1034740 [compost metagenome]